MSHTRSHLRRRSDTRWKYPLKMEKIPVSLKGFSSLIRPITAQSLLTQTGLSFSIYDHQNLYMDYKAII